MKLINMASNQKSFQIYMNGGLKSYSIQEVLFVRHGNSFDRSGQDYEFDEYKIRIPINRFGQFRTFLVRYLKEKDSWYISDNVEDLLSITTSAGY